MSEAIPQDRSPRSPSFSLEDAINMVSKLFDAIRSAVVAPEIAVKPLGYGGTNGAAMTTLATLAQYGLVDRSGGKVAVTPLAIRIIHPKGEMQRSEAIRESALFPKVMKELYDGYLDCAESVITGHLIQSGFNADRAKRLAAIHSANKTFARLGESVTPPADPVDTDVIDSKTETPLTSGASNLPFQKQSAKAARPDGGADHFNLDSTKVLAKYTIPLGENEAHLVFTGQSLNSDDFDALIEFVEFAKKQLTRRQTAAMVRHDPTKFMQAIPPNENDSPGGD